MVSHLIDLARQAGIMVELLRKENGSKETALHEAVRIGDHGIVLELLTADPELARFPEAGTSALYLSVLLKLNSIVQTLLDKDNDLSFSGPNGQTALHAAVLRGPELTKKLLQWNAAQIDKDLTAKKDENGSTPLHFAAGLPVYFAAGLPVCFAAGLLKAVQNLESVCWQVFRDNTDALYQPDIDGLFPIHHVAASVGAVQTVAMFVEKCGKSASLRDAKGRTFLHVAAEKNKLCVVRYASRSPSLAWIMNMRDNDGNTAMHLAVQAGNLLSFSALFDSRCVSLNLPNAKGQTPRDIAQYKVPPLSFDLPDTAFTLANASSGVCRGDHFRRDYEDVHRNSEYEIKEMGMLKDSTQILSVGSVLIAIVTFGATFALPGGYRADDHTDGGTPTLAGGIHSLHS